MVAIAEEVGDLVMEYGGSMSGEHGDGLVRSWFNRKMFGDQSLRSLPETSNAYLRSRMSIMNPGKIVDSQEMTENLQNRPRILSPDSVWRYRLRDSAKRAVSRAA